MFTIGEFSRITQLSIKTLRFYHEEGILIPSRVDPSTGYRYYDKRKVEEALSIIRLRNLGMSLDDIRGILESFDDESDILLFLERQKEVLFGKIQESKSIIKTLNQVIAKEKEAQQAMQNSTFEVEEKTLPPMLIAGVRMRGKYSDCGKGFSSIGKHFGRFLCGKPFNLYYDEEYRPDNADFEACFPISQGKEVEGISVRELAGTRCVTLMHQGPYEELGRSYARILEYTQQHQYKIVPPTREIYIKGPGMILRGNPRKYLTEIQIPIEG